MSCDSPQGDKGEGRRKEEERRRKDGYDIDPNCPIRALHFEESLCRGEKCDLLFFCSSKRGCKPKLEENPGVTVYKIRASWPILQIDNLVTKIISLVVLKIRF